MNPTTARLTRQLIQDIDEWVDREHGDMTPHLAQIMTGHGIFKSYLAKIGKLVSPLCTLCELEENDNAEHTFERCTRFAPRREQAARLLGAPFPLLKDVVPIMLDSKEKWDIISAYVSDIMGYKEETERHIETIFGRR
jgi:hypothetical protein